MSEQGGVRQWWATMFLRRAGPGDKPRAIEMLQDANSVYEQYGMTKHSEIAETLLRAES